MSESEREIIIKLDKCDFSEIQSYNKQVAEQYKKMTPEERLVTFTLLLY